MFSESSLRRPRRADGASGCELRIHAPRIDSDGGSFLVHDKQATEVRGLGLNAVDHLWTLRPNIAAAAASVVVVVVLRPYAKYPPGPQGFGAFRGRASYMTAVALADAHMRGERFGNKPPLEVSQIGRAHV